MPVRILSDTDVTRQVLGGTASYAIWVGAGVSAESGVQTASQISDSIRSQLLKDQDSIDPQDAAAVEQWANRTLDWGDPQRRYTTSISKAHPNAATRISYFRSLLRESRPAFAHYATVLLTAFDWIDKTCLTTNFDHLLERAFAELNLIDYQAIRSDEETRFWNQTERRCFILKLHGDIDTNNILNTPDETLELGKNMARTVFSVLRNKGLVVLGAASNEKSIWKIFESLQSEMKADPSILSFGLLWGVYMGTKKPRGISEDALATLLQKQIETTGINRNIVELLNRSDNELFAFFPVWGAGSFMFDLIAATDQRETIGIAMRYLDHEMRLRSIFKTAGLSEETVDQHLTSLREQRAKISSAKKSVAEGAEEVLRAADATGRLKCCVLYGDITSRSLLDSSNFKGCRRAVVSPEDTYITAGGGVAFSLLKKAGDLLILNELSKLAPISHRSVAVTSGGNLPVHYIFHAAALRIDDGPVYAVTRADVQATAAAIFTKALALEVGVVWLPLIGAGVASLSPADSFSGVLEAIAALEREAGGFTRNLTITIVIFKERLLPRHEVEFAARQLLASRFAIEKV